MGWVPHGARRKRQRATHARLYVLHQLALGGLYCSTSVLEGPCIDQVGIHPPLRKPRTSHLRHPLSRRRALGNTSSEFRTPPERTTPLDGAIRLACRGWIIRPKASRGSMLACGLVRRLTAGG